MLMNAKRGSSASARTAAVRTHGEATSVAAVVATCYTWESMTLASVSCLAWIPFGTSLYYGPGLIIFLVSHSKVLMWNVLVAPSNSPSFVYNNALIWCFFSSNIGAGKVATSSVGWGFMWVIFFGLGFAGVGAYAVYKYRLRVKCSSIIATLF